MSHVAVTVNMCCKYRGYIDWRVVIYWCLVLVSADNITNWLWLYIHRVHVTTYSLVI